MKSSHYRLLGLIGEGQFGKVYTAIHHETGELVALKELNPRQFSTKKFLREIRILLTLNHPNIVSCHGVEHNARGRYLVTEYCEGGTLRDLMESTIQLNLEQKIKLVVDILSGLNHAHTEGIIHRDIKPENILLTLTPQGWVAKVSDFGVAKIEKEDQGSHNISLGDTGSPAYMAPEQFYGKYSYSSDLYAVGIILYELLSGDRPFSGSPSEIMSGHLNQSPQIPDSIPQSLQEFLDKNLQKLPQHRFRTAQEMKTVLLKTLLDFSENDLILSTSFPQSEISLNLIKEVNLETEVNSIISNSKQLFIADNNTVNIVNYNISSLIPKANLFSWQSFYLNPQIKIIQLHLTTLGCIALTQNEENLEEYQLWQTQPEIKSLISLKLTNLVYAIAPNQQWLAVIKKEETQAEKKQGFQIINLKNLQPVNILIEDFFPLQLLAIDNHHGLSIYQQPELKKDDTFWRFFTRRGTWVNSYSFSIPLSNVTVNNFHNNYFLAHETFTNNVIFIKINPFKVNRINLKFSPDFILAFPDKFLCANHLGEISCLDLEGNYLGYTQLNITIDQINYLGDNSVILITKQNQKSLLQIYHLEDV